MNSRRLGIQMHTTQAQTNIDFEVEVGADKGTQPSAETQIDFQTKPQPEAAAEKKIEHILIIDDDELQVEVLSHNFISQGYRVSIAHNCSAGREKAAELSPDLILLDIGLPDGDGLDICSELCDDPTTSEIPVVVVSGQDNNDVVRQARKAGCHYFVRKPYDPNALLVLAKSAIQEGGAWKTPYPRTSTP